MEDFSRFDKQQLAALADTENIWRDLRAATAQYQKCRGTVFIRKGSIFKCWYPHGDGHRIQQAIHPTDPIAYKNEFEQKHEASIRDLRDAKSLQDRQARVNTVLKISSAPVSLCSILSGLESGDLIDDFVVGSVHAVYAYEIEAKGAFNRRLLDGKQPVELLARRQIFQNEFRKALKKGDKTFEVHAAERPTAINAAGQVVRIPNLLPTGEIDGLHAPVDYQSGVVDRTIIDEKGYPARLRAVEPRRFSLRMQRRILVEGTTTERQNELQIQFRELCGILFKQLGLSIEPGDFAHLMTDSGQQLQRFMADLRGA